MSDILYRRHKLARDEPKGLASDTTTAKRKKLMAAKPAYLNICDNFMAGYSSAVPVIFASLHAVCSVTRE